MRATLHRLLAGASLVVLTVFGLTVLSLIDPDDTKVWGFTNETCNSEWSMLFHSLEEMLEYEGTTDQWGMTWNFESYYKSAEINAGIVTCHLVGQVDPKIVVKRTPIKLPFGGGGQKPVPAPKPQEPSPGETGPEEPEFDDDDLTEMNDRWQGCADKLKSVEDYVDYEVTDYKWETKDGYAGPGPIGKGVMAQTHHEEDNKRVEVFPKALANNAWEIEFEQITMITLLQEYVHTIQGWMNPLKDDGFKREVEAYNLSIAWYKMLFPKKAPPFEPWTKQDIADAKKTQGYKNDMKKIKAYRDHLDAGGALSKEQLLDLQALAAGLVHHIPDYIFNQNYDTGPLVCKDKKKK